MSADNTVVILATRRRDGTEGLEYRVAHVRALENMDYQPDYPLSDPRFNRESVLEMFGDSKVLLSYLGAYCEAERLEKEAKYVENGIVDLDFPDVLFPEDKPERVVDEGIPNRLLH